VLRFTPDDFKWTRWAYNTIGHAKKKENCLLTRISGGARGEAAGGLTKWQ